MTIISTAVVSTPLSKPPLTSKQILTPSSGAVILLNARIALTVINPVSGLSALTLTMPNMPADGLDLQVYILQSIALLTVNGGSVIGCPTSVNPAAAVRFVYDKPSLSWYVCADRLGLSGTVPVPLSIANGGTGTPNPGLTAGDGITIDGHWPSQRVSAIATAVPISGVTSGGGAGGVSILSFPGVTGDGNTDQTLAIRAAVTAAGTTPLYFPPGTYLISAQINLVSAGTYFGAGSSSIIKCATNDINMFSLNTCNNVTIRALKFLQTSAGSAAVAQISIYISSYTLVENCEFQGCQFYGVRVLLNSHHNTIRRNYIHDFLGTAQPTADIAVIDNCDYNVIEGNQCLGGINSGTGILVQADTTTVYMPKHTRILNNNITAHGSYGIVLYSDSSVDTSRDSFSLVDGNHIQDIDGAELSGNAGAGIYCASNSGLTICNNIIKNCCISTSSLTLVPAGIGLNLTGITSGSGITVENNIIIDMAQYHGIYVCGNPGIFKVNVVGNTIQFKAGAGATIGIRCQSSSGLNINSNTISLDSTIASAFGIYATATANFSVVNMNGNSISGCSAAGIYVVGTGHTVSKVSIVGNTVDTSASTGSGIAALAVASLAVTGNVVTAGSGTYALNLNATPTARITGNTFETTGTTSILMQGACTGLYFDKSNYWGALMNNASTGGIVETLGSVSPSTSTWAVGDRVAQSVPVVGNPKGWRCTVAGAPGTWVSEGNL